MKKQVLLLIAILCLLIVAALPVLAQDGVTIDILNVRSGAGSDFPIVTEIGARVDVVIEGRNNIGDWVLIHTPDSAIRGWVASRFIDFNDDIVLANLPVSEEIIGGAVVEAAPEAPTESAAQQPAAPESSVAGVGTGELISMMNVRTGPGTTYDSVGQLDQGLIVTIEGRNTAGDWLMINAGGVRGWVYSPYVKLLDVEFATLPVSYEVIGGESLAPTPEVIEIPLPERNIEAMEARLRSIPILHNMVNDTVYEIFANGRVAGNNPRIFMKVGDSVTATQPFMSGFGRGDYNLGANYGYLQPTIDWFSVSPRPGVANSFVNESIAAQSGFTSDAIFDGLWVNPSVCREAALYCEYTLTKPSVAIILLGSVDLRSNSAFDFQNNIHRAALELIRRGVIPVLTTFPNHPDIMGEDAIYFNNLILNAADAYNVPVINLWLATQPLPDAGINLNDPIHMTQGANYFHFDAGQENLYGVSLRNLLTLQALDTLRVNVLSQ